MPLDAVITPMGELTPQDRDQWREWQLARPELRSPFFSIGFSDAVAAVGQGVSVAKLMQGGRLVGFFPFQKRGTTAYPVGAPMNDYHAVIAAVDVDIGLEELVSLLPAKRLSVNSWLGGETAPSDNSLALSTCQALVGAEGYEAWFEERRRQYNKYFKDKMRSRRGMEASFGLLRVELRDADHAGLDQLIELKSRQYRRTGRHDVFRPEWTRALLHRLLDGDEACKATLATLWAGDTLLALEISLHADGVWHFWFPAYLEVGARYSPGIWLSLETMRQAHEEGYVEFDYGFSGEAYKKYFCNRSRDVLEAVLGDGDWISVLERVKGRGGLTTSARRRWSAIQASESHWTGQCLGTLFAGRNLITRLGRGES